MTELIRDRRYGYLWLALATLLLYSPVERLRGEEPTKVKPGSFVSALPKDTLLFLRVANAKQLVQKVEKSPLYRIKDRPEIKAILDSIKRELGAEFTQTKDQLKFDPAEMVSAVEGEVVFAVGGLDALGSQAGQALSMGSAPDISLESVPIVLVAESGSSSSKMHGYMEKIFAFAEKEGAKRETWDLAGAKITTLSDASEAPAPEKAEAKRSDGEDKDSEEGDSSAGDSEEPAPPAAAGVKLYFGEMGTRFFFGTSRAFLEKFVKSLSSGGADSLAGVPSFQETQKLTGEGDISIFVNIKSFTGSMGSALSQTFFGFYWQKVEELVFGKGLNNLGITMDLESRGIRQRSFIHNAGQIDGLLALLKTSGFSSTPASVLPGDAQTFTSFSFNPVELEKTVRAVAQIAMSFSSDGGNLDALFEQQVGVKLKDLLGSLGQRAHHFGPVPTTANPMEALNFALELKDEAPLKGLISKFMGGATGGAAPEKYKDSDIYTMPLPTGELALAFAGKTLVLAGSKSLAKKVIDRAGEPAPAPAGGEEFKSLASTLGVPPSVCLLGYSSKAYMEYSLKNIGESLKTSGLEGVDELNPVISALTEVMGASISYAVWKEKGLYGDSLLLYKNP